MKNSRKELLYLLIPFSMITIIICLFLGAKYLLFSGNQPKLDIYKVLESPVKYYDHIAIKDSSVDIENLNIDDFKPYSDRVFSVDNNHSSIDFFWESNSCLAIEYDYQEVKTYNIKEDVFTKWTFTGNNESPVINIKYIDE